MIQNKYVHIVKIFIFYIKNPGLEKKKVVEIKK
jgi:hypothetical protein